MTRKKVEDSPGIDLDKPVSRQMETDLYGYYGWAPYWTAGYWPGAAVVPPAGAAPPEIAPTRRPAGPKGAPHLRTVQEAPGQHIRRTAHQTAHCQECRVRGG